MTDIKTLFERIAKVRPVIFTYVLKQVCNQYNGVVINEEYILKCKGKSYYADNRFNINHILEVAEELGFKIFVGLNDYGLSKYLSTRITNLECNVLEIITSESYDQPAAFLAGLEKCVTLLEEKKK